MRHIICHNIFGLLSGEVQYYASAYLWQHVITVFRRNVLLPSSRHACPENGSSLFTLKLLKTFWWPH